MNSQSRPTIGFVLPSVPGYSQTFFHSKLQKLKAAGYSVLLFVNTLPSEATRLPYSTYAAPSVQGRGLRAGLRVLWVLLGLAIQAPANSLRFVRLERRQGRGWAEVMRRLFISAHILRRRVDVLQFGFVSMAHHRELVAKALRAKLAISLRGYDITTYPAKRTGCYQQLWEQVDGIHTISDDLLRAAERWGLPPGQALVHRIPPAIDVAAFTQSAPLRWPGEGEPLHILTVARLNWKKGLADAIRGLALLISAEVDAHLTVMGAGEERNYLITLANLLGVGQRLHLRGKAPHAEVRQQYAQAHVYWQPSLQEGFCNAALEAQASGLLCIVSNAEGLPENVLHGQTGWVVPKADPQALAERTLSVIRLEETERQRIRQAAQQRVAEQFDLAQQTAAFAGFYERLLRG